MRTRSFSLASRGVKGIVVPLASGRFRNLSFQVQSTGCVVSLGSSKDTASVVYSGDGWAEVFTSTSATHLFAEGAGIVLMIPELREHTFAGWSNEPSLTDLEPRPLGAISPEIQAVMDRMNRNAIIREQAMLASLGRR